MSAAEVAAGDDAIYRVSGRRIMMSSILLDVIAVAYTVLTVAIYFNIIRLNVYQPAMMDPWWTWTPYWRVYGPVGFLMCLPTFLYLLVFYRRAALMALYLVMTVLFIVFGGICFGWLIADWVDCKNTLWCPCLTDWNIVGGMITMTYCDSAHQDRASPVFLAHFFMFLGELILAGVMAGIATWIHFQYYYRNEAYNVNNQYRTLAYTGIASEMTEEGNYYSPETKRARSPGTGKQSSQHPHLSDVRSSKRN